jgi:hypothetical protein
MFISGWLSPPLNVLAAQLENAASRINLDMSRYFFVYDSRLECSVQHLLKVKGNMIESAEDIPQSAMGFMPSARVNTKSKAHLEMTIQSTNVLNPVVDGATVGNAANAALHSKGLPVLRPRRQAGNNAVTQSLLKSADAVSNASDLDGLHSTKGPDNETKSLTLTEMCLAVMLNSSAKPITGLGWFPVILTLVGGNAIWGLYAVYGLLGQLEMTAQFLFNRIGICVCTQVNLYVLLAFWTTGTLDMVFRDNLAEFITKLTQPTIISRRVLDDGDSDATVMPISVLSSPQGKRLERLLKAVSDGISHSGVDVGRYKLPPIIDMSRQVNAFAWYRMRTLLTDIGRVFQYRLQLFITSCAMLVLFLDISVILTYYVSDRGADTYCRSLSADLLYVQAILLSVVLVGSLGFIIVTGSNANNKRALQEDSFVQAAVDIDEIARDVAIVAGAAASGKGASRGAQGDNGRTRGASAAELAFAADKVRQVLTLDAGSQDFSMGAALVHAVMERAGTDGYDDTLQGVLDELRGAGASLATLQRAIKVQDETSPVMVLGMRASPALVQVLGTGISFLAGFMLLPYQAIGSCQGGMHT